MHTKLPNHFTMKRSLLLICLTIPFFGFAQVGGDVTDEEIRENQAALIAALQDSVPKIWDVGGQFTLNFSQTYLSNWAAGGQNSLAGTSFASMFARYKKNRHSWENTLDLAYGILSQDDRSPIKTDDRIDFTSKYGYETQVENLFYSALFNFRTQFAPGYEIVEGREEGESISDFLAPAFSIFSLGIDYKPSENFSMMVAPLAAKATIVNIDRLATAYGLEEGENIRMEFGAFVKVAYTTDIMTNVNWQTRLDLFSNYLENPQNVDVNWENLITMKINEWLSASIITQLIYDDDIIIGAQEAVIVDDVVVTPATSGGPRTQFKEVFSLGLSLRI